MFHVKHNILHKNVSKESVDMVDKLLTKNAEPLGLYVDQLLWWNKKVNLISRDVSRETVWEHMRHSLLISQLEEFKGAAKIVDTGSGGGLPGIPLAVCYADKKIILNDIVSKKMMAVKQMAIRLGLQNVEVISGSVKHLNLEEETLIITKHAFKVDELIRLLDGKNWEKLIFLKGASESEDEVNKVQKKLKATITHLDKAMNLDFYKGKALVKIERIEHE